MSPEILLVPSGVLLVPGATGRSDVARTERDAVVDALARALARGHGRGADRLAERERPERPSRPVEVMVVAPAPMVGCRATDRGVPDLGALGMLDAGDLLPAPPLRAPTDRLHVAASVVTVLLRLAGWRDTISTVEIGAAALTAAPGARGSGEEAPDWPTGARAVHAAQDEAARLVVFTTIGTRGVRTGPAEAVAGPLPGSTLPPGVPDLLARADRAVARLYRDALGARVT